MSNNELSVYPKNDLFNYKDIKLSIDAKLDVYHKRNSVDVPTLITNAANEISQINLDKSTKDCTDKKCMSFALLLFCILHSTHYKFRFYLSVKRLITK